MEKVRELCSLIHRKFDSESALARELNWPRQRLNKITTGAKEPDLSEAALLAEKLDTSLEHIASIFISYKSPNGQQKRRAV